ncbi:MAG: AraC family transcriptional regulator [Hyphomonadaceae bacterium]
MTGAMTGEYTQLLLGLCAGALLAMAAAMLRSPRFSARWSGFLFFFTSAFFAAKLWADAAGAFPFEVRCVVNVIAMSSVGWFFLMVRALFADCDDFQPISFAAPASLALVGLVHQFPVHDFHYVLWIVGSGLQVGLALAALIIVVRSWKGDLVESRRRLRGPFMASVSLYILSLNGFDLWGVFGEVPAWYPMFNAALLAGIVLGGAFTFLDPRNEMFGAQLAALPPRQPETVPQSAQPVAQLNGHAPDAAHATAAAIDRAAKVDLDCLENLMSREQVWKEEGLTIASLALRARIPETQLRRLINDCLGYRNFPSYVNAHRIAAAKSRLADPIEARISISTIAYDIGFASLGPFNRAFKEEAGVSPSEWRRKALEIPSPIPEPA